MPQRCTVCVHAERAAIDARLAAADTPFRTIAERYNVSKTALVRHRDDHLPARLVKAQAAGDIREAFDVVQQLTLINGVTLEILRDARAAGQKTVALMAIDRVQKQIELQAKLIGMLQQEGTTNVVVSAQWLEIRAVIVQALTPYPDARAAVAAALSEIDHAG